MVVISRIDLAPFSITECKVNQAFELKQKDIMNFQRRCTFHWPSKAIGQTIRVPPLALVLDFLLCFSVVSFLFTAGFWSSGHPLPILASIRAIVITVFPSPIASARIYTHTSWVIYNIKYIYLPVNEISFMKLNHGVILTPPLAICVAVGNFVVDSPEKMFT